MYTPTSYSPAGRLDAAAAAHTTATIANSTAPSNVSVADCTAERIGGGGGGGGGIGGGGGGGGGGSRMGRGARAQAP